jgi:F-type H+-transporting ATPase subunit gamma
MPDADIPLMTANNESKAVLIVAFASNTGLCGAFNSNVIRRTTEIVEQYRAKAYDVRLYTLGKKVYERFAYDNDIRVENLPFDIHEHPTYERLSEIAEQIISLYLDKKVDRVIMIYNRFKNILTQYITEQTLLPDLSLSDLRSVSSIDYIMEPDKKTLIDVLAPQIVKLRFYETLLESLSAEYGARSSAMQAATDNANDLIGELSTLYNKVRQSAITGELIDIVGGSEALK